MNRKGHVGMALLAFAPIAYLLITDGKFALAVLGWLGIQAVEPLPDQDFHLPWLTHRGISHSLVAVLVVGGVLGAVGWLLGDQLFDLLYVIFSTGGNLWDWVLQQLPDTSASLLAGIVPNIPPSEIVATIKQQAGGTVDRSAFAIFGFAVGAGGILAHLLGDIITTRGVKPFQPLSRWQLSLSPLRADNPTANSGLFFLGVFAVVVVVGATVPGMVLGAGIPADISPIGVASAQDASPSAPNGSVTINETASNRSRIILESVTLPKHGYIVARTGNLSANQSATKVIGHTTYVQNGSFQGVVLALNESVAKGATVVVTLHNDTNDNETWDGIQTDAAYAVNGTPIHDNIHFKPSESGNQSHNQSEASVVFANQTTNGSTITIKRATLPDGGFIVLTANPYREIGILENSIIAVSKPLSPGIHRNITIDVSHSPPGGVVNQTSLSVTSDYAAGVFYDSNNNSEFDFIVSRDADQPYIVGEKGQKHFAADAAFITVPSASTPTPTASIQFNNQTADDSTVVIESVTLPNGGFVVIHSESYLHGGDPLESVVGHSEYLSPGTHHTVTVPLNGSIQQSQTLVAVPARDTNSNQRYDFRSSGGFRDVAYTGNGQIITDRATVKLPDRPASASPTTTAAAQSSSAASGTKQPTEPTNEGGVGGWVSANPLLAGLIGIVGLAILPTVVRRFQR